MLSLRWPAATPGSLLFTLESMVKTVFGLKRWNKSKQRIQTELFALWDSLRRLIPDWLRCADKAASPSSHACDILSFPSLPLNGFFCRKSKKYNLILPPFYRCVCPVFPFLLWKCLTGFYEIWCKHRIIAAIGEACGDWGGGVGVQGRQMALKYFFNLSIVFFSTELKRGKKRSGNIFWTFIWVA